MVNSYVWDYLLFRQQGDVGNFVSALNPDFAINWSATSALLGPRLLYGVQRRLLVPRICPAGTNRKIGDDWRRGDFLRERFSSVSSHVQQRGRILRGNPARLLLDCSP